MPVRIKEPALEVIALDFMV